jgi:hypothetical protein
MLFKVWTTENFADESDRIGVIEAENLSGAIERLKAWAIDTLPDPDYTQVGSPEVFTGPGYAYLHFRLRDDDGNVGQDSYKLVSHEGPLMFLADDWRYLFS